MGISYSQHRMIGYYIEGLSEAINYFLKKNGYNLSDDEFDDVLSNNGFYGDVAKKYNIDTEIEIISMDSWSGHDYFIGYDLRLKEEYSPEADELRKKFSKNFPKSFPEFSSFTSVG